MTSVKEENSLFINNNNNSNHIEILDRGVKSKQINLFDNVRQQQQQFNPYQRNNSTNTSICSSYQQLKHKQQQEQTNNHVVPDQIDNQPKKLPHQSNNCLAEITYNSEQRDLFVAQIKRELSLPHDIRIPEHFIAKRLSLCNIHHFNLKSDKQQQVEAKQDDCISGRQAGVLYNNEIVLPESSKQLQNLHDIIKSTESKPASRVVRRQSLYEIGFGQISTYQKIRVIGSGSYSSVYKGTSRLTNESVALKEILLQRDEGVPFTAIREVSLLKELKHANIITLHDFIYTKKYLTLVFEHMDYDLSVYMSLCEYKISERNVKLFLFQLLRGLNYCHQRRVLHRDLKPQNLLLNERGELKLADFGLARAKSVPIKTFTDEVVTLWYRPPDVLLGNTDYGPSIDIWGVGCIFYEMATGRTLFTGGSPNHQLKGIFETIGSPTDMDWPNFTTELIARDIELDRRSSADFSHLEPRVGQSGIDLLEKFLKCEPRSRISSSEAMYHNYFSTLPDSIYRLSDSQSIFKVSSIKFAPDKMINTLSYQ